jgi:RNA polymerase sigma-70 factor (ECF subfamily)
MDDLSALLHSAAEGDRKALGEFVARSQTDVWRFCRSIVGTAQADDVTQETFLRAWRSASTFRAESTARTWLLSIARRVCYDQLRKQHRNETLDADRSSGPSDAGETQALLDLIERLEPDRRTAFVLTQLHGLSYQQTAEICDCPIGTIRSRVARARTDLLGTLLADDVGRDQDRRT